MKELPALAQATPFIGFPLPFAACQNFGPLGKPSTPENVSVLSEGPSLG